MSWILIAFLEPIFYALGNILDSNLINRMFKGAWALNVFVAVACAFFIPFLWLIEPPGLISFNLLLPVFIVAFIELFYSYPYYKALENEETSIAISLFSLGKIIVPILAFFILGESLYPIQYFGFFLIVISSTFLTFNPTEKVKLNKSFFYMLLASSLLAAEVVIYKYIFNEVNWSTGFFWTVSISALMGASSYFIPKVKREMRSEFPLLKKYYSWLLLVGLVGFIGSIGFTFPISEAPATVSRSIGSFQPFFVLLYAVIFARHFPAIFKEKIDFGNIVKKVILFIFTTIGIVLTIK